MTGRAIISVLLTCLLGALPAPAAAHRQPEVETTVRVVQGEGGEAMQLTHRLHAHDALRALRGMGVASPDLAEPEHRARLALYALDRLDLAGDAKSEVVGAEVEGNYLFVYVSHPERAAIEGASMLSDVSPAWSNTVHIEDASGRTVRSVTFTAENPSAPEPLPPSPARDFVEGH